MIGQKVSVIIPVYASPNRKGFSKALHQRVITCIGALYSKLNIDVEVHTNLPLGTLSHKNINIHQSNSLSEIYSPGQSRNKAILDSQSKYIFIVDVDLICSPAIVNKIQDVNAILGDMKKAIFQMYPCLYLTKEETERFDGDFQGCLESFLRGENHRVEGIALASSCLLMNREWFLQLGGFDEQFVGHGGEDLELIDRLTRHYPIGPRPYDYALNIKAQHPGDYQGFRRYFSYYALPHLFAGRFLVHQWHPRPLTHPYHRRRAENDALLETMLARPRALRGPVVPCDDLGGTLPEFRQWMATLQEAAGYPVAEYPGLFRWREEVKRSTSVWRKVRKMYLNPALFIKDMINKK